MTISKDAVLLWNAYFRNAGNTLSFGGDDSSMEISVRGRKALNELLECGAVDIAKPYDTIPNREHYQTGKKT